MNNDILEDIYFFVRVPACNKLERSVLIEDMINNMRQNINSDKLWRSL